jgi:hypothetical protein
VPRWVRLAPLFFLGGCQLTAYPPRTVSLRVKGDVADAEVTIDDIAIGALGYVAAHGVALPPGRHRVTVEKTGYFPWDGVVEAKDDPIDLQIHLDPIPD